MSNEELYQLYYLLDLYLTSLSSKETKFLVIKLKSLIIDFFRGFDNKK